tara:strand:- start:184 stop:501 length:318 start_codon:yes stop_codon:yes gene_type:complete
MKNKLIYIICLLTCLSSCQTLKDGLTGKKKENSDEFLVEKKNPLELPPSYGELPEPKTEIKENLENSIDENIEELIETVSENEDINFTSEDKSAEDLVLKEIKEN